MTTRYGEAYNAIAREQARVTERALTMVMEDEARARRDAVLIALDLMRDRLQERGVPVAPQEVLAVLEEVTGFPIAGQRLPVLLQHARKREESRRCTDARKILEEATRNIEAGARSRTTPNTLPEGS